MERPRGASNGRRLAGGGGPPPDSAPRAQSPGTSRGRSRWCASAIRSLGPGSPRPIRIRIRIRPAGSRPSPPSAGERAQVRGSSPAGSGRQPPQPHPSPPQTGARGEVRRPGPNRMRMGSGSPRFRGCRRRVAPGQRTRRPRPAAPGTGQARRRVRPALRAAGPYRVGPQGGVEGLRPAEGAERPDGAGGGTAGTALPTPGRLTPPRSSAGTAETGSSWAWRRRPRRG